MARKTRIQLVAGLASLLYVANVPAEAAELNNQQTKVIFDLSSARFAEKVCTDLIVNPVALAELSKAIESIEAADLVESQSTRDERELDGDYKAAPTAFCKAMQRLYGSEGSALKNLLVKRRSGILLPAAAELWAGDFASSPRCSS